MRYAQLKAFHNVALHLGFSSAAKALNMTQPALSDQVRKLEQEYDVLLFDRSRRQIQLTQAGVDLLAHTKRLFEVEAIAEEYLTQSTSSRETAMTIATDSPRYFAPILAAFRLDFPDTRFSVKIGTPGEVSRSLRDYSADVGFLGYRPAGSDFRIVQVGRSQIVAVTSADMDLGNGGRVTLKDLSSETIVLREEGSRTRGLVENTYQAARMPLKPIIEATGRAAHHEIISEGGVVGFMSKDDIGVDPRLKCYEIEGSTAIVEEFAVCLHDRSSNTVIDSFMKIAKDHAI